MPPFLCPFTPWVPPPVPLPLPSHDFSFSPARILSRGQRPPGPPHGERRVAPTPAPPSPPQHHGTSCGVGVGAERPPSAAPGAGGRPWGAEARGGGCRCWGPGQHASARGACGGACAPPGMWGGRGQERGIPLAWGVQGRAGRALAAGRKGEAGTGRGGTGERGVAPGNLGLGGLNWTHTHTHTINHTWGQACVCGSMSVTKILRRGCVCVYVLRVDDDGQTDSGCLEGSTDKPLCVCI